MKRDKLYRILNEYKDLRKIYYSTNGIIKRHDKKTAKLNKEILKDIKELMYMIDKIE